MSMPEKPEPQKLPRKALATIAARKSAPSTGGVKGLSMRIFTTKEIYRAEQARIDPLLAHIRRRNEADNGGYYHGNIMLECWPQAAFTSPERIQMSPILWRDIQGDAGFSPKQRGVLNYLVQRYGLAHPNDAPLAVEGLTCDTYDDYDEEHTDDDLDQIVVSYATYDAVWTTLVPVMAEIRARNAAYIGGDVQLEIWQSCAFASREAARGLWISPRLLRSIHDDDDFRINQRNALWALLEQRPALGEERHHPVSERNRDHFGRGCSLNFDLGESGGAPQRRSAQLV